MTKKERAKKKLEELIEWAYRSSFADVFKYNPADKITKISQKTEEKVNNFLNKYL